MSDMNEQRLFQQQVNWWVDELLLRGASGFGEVVRELPGVYPSEVFRAMQECRISLPAGFFGADSKEEELHSPQANDLAWPVPHPLDYDWRFTPETAQALATRSAEPAPEGRIALLGAPSLVPYLVRQGSWWITLFDANPLILDVIHQKFPQVQTTFVDLVWGEQGPESGTEVVVCDPPWYPEHVLSFLWSARRLCSHGGIVLLSTPPVGTRPGIEIERREIRRFAKRLGLELIGWEPLALRYQSPRFEQNALKAVGFSAIPQDWRRGDLVTFRCAAPCNAERPIPTSNEEVWDEIEVGGTRIKLRCQNETGFLDPRLISVVPNNVLPTVSRRDARRSDVDLWTSGNRVFKVRGVNVLRQILKANGKCTVQAVGSFLQRRLRSNEANLVIQAADQISDLLRIEQDHEEIRAKKLRGSMPTGA